MSNRECLSLPKDSELYHCSTQSTQEGSSVHENLKPCALVDSETKRKIFPFKEELETFKVQVISKIKNLILKNHLFQKKLSPRIPTLMYFPEKLKRRNFIKNSFIS